jgi:hypothetical protein
MDKFKKDISLRFRMKDLGAGDGDRKGQLREKRAIPVRQTAYVD